MKQYLYRIMVTRPEMLLEGPTEEEQRITTAHFNYLKDLEAQGKLILAGRTQTTEYSSFGIVIFLAENDEEAKAIMHNDPVIQHRVMRGELFPYRLAIFNSDNLTES